MCKVSDIKGLYAYPSIGSYIQQHKSDCRPYHCISYRNSCGGTYIDSIPHKRQCTDDRHGNQPSHVLLRSS